MSSHYVALQAAVYRVDADGNACNPDYGDVYHSRAGALQQARHVFLRGNGLPLRWQGRDSFTICETGFGLGHNFLACWQAWQDDPLRSRRLHYLAFDAHPFQLADLRRAWARLPDRVQGLANQLAGLWPELLPGVHRLELDSGRLVLTLIWGDIRRTARQAMAHVDAFFLDGFAPRVNPAMWTPALFGQLRRLAHAGATAATWCAAGQVRRDLQDAGFVVGMAPGFAGKREMTTASLRPGLGSSVQAVGSQKIAIVGGGIAGSSIALGLARRGHRVEVWDPACALDQEPSLRARGAAALVPALSPDDDTRSRLSRAGLALARALWMGFDEPARPLDCGALLCATSPAHEALQQHAIARLQFPPGWVSWLGPELAAQQAGVPLQYGGLWFPHALRACPGELAAAQLSLPGVRRIPLRVGGLQQESSGWALLDEHGKIMGCADQLVLANAAQAVPLLAGVARLDAWPVLSGTRTIAGQVSLYQADSGDAVPHCILSGEGYCLPPLNGWGLAGSTYKPDAAMSGPDITGHAEILARLASWLPPGAVPWLGRGPAAGWAGIRAATRDHLPVMGPVPGCPGLWLACAYGSRGLSWSVLAGELFGSLIDAEPVPLERELMRRVGLR